MVGELTKSMEKIGLDMRVAALVRPYFPQLPGAMLKWTNDRLVYVISVLGFSVLHPVDSYFVFLLWMMLTCWGDAGE